MTTFTVFVSFRRASEWAFLWIWTLVGWVSFARANPSLRLLLTTFRCWSMTFIHAVGLSRRAAKLFWTATALFRTKQCVCQLPARRMITTTGAPGLRCMHSFDEVLCVLSGPAAFSCSFFFFHHCSSSYDSSYASSSSSSSRSSSSNSNSSSSSSSAGDSSSAFSFAPPSNSSLSVRASQKKLRRKPQNSP